MASDTRAAVVHYRVLQVRAIPDDIDGRVVDSLALFVHNEVPLQAIRQIENDFAAVGMKIEWILEDVLLRTVAGEIEAFPIRAINRGVPFHCAIVAGHP